MCFMGVFTGLEGMIFGVGYGEKTWLRVYDQISNGGSIHLQHGEDSQKIDTFRVTARKSNSL